MKKAVIYARYSSDSQSEQSIEGQLRVVKKFAKDNDYVIVNTYIDRAATGTNDNRAGFQKMISDSELKGFSFVIVYKLDRFSRNRFDSAFNKKLLRKNGVRVISATEGITDSPEGIILESMLEGYAEYYSAELSQKVRRGQYESLQKGTFLGGMMLYGYKSNNKKIEVEEEKAFVVKKMFSLYASGMTAKAVADTLKAEGFRNNLGRYFCKNSIMNLLKNKKYNGILEYGKYRYENYFPKIIEDDLFNKVQQRIERNKRSPARMKAYCEYKLSGKLYCGHCKSLMTGESGTSKLGIIYNYYKCFGRKKHNGCKKESVKKDAIENLVADLALRHILADDKIMDTIDNIVISYNDTVKDSAELSLFKQEQSQNNKYLDNLLTAIKNGIFSDTTQSELLKLEKRKQELEEQIIIKEAQQDNQLTKEKVLNYFKEFVNSELSDDEAKTSIIEHLVNKVILYDKKITIILNNNEDGTIDADISDIEEIVCSNLAQHSPPLSHNPNIIITKNFVIIDYVF